MKKLFIIFILFILTSCLPIGERSTKIIAGEEIMLKRIGEEFNVKVSVQNATDVIGLNAWISYDPTIIEVVDIDAGTVDTQIDATDLGFLSNAQLLIGIQKDGGGVERPGTLVCGYVNIPPTPVSGDGDCFSVRFRAITQGTTNIDFVTDHVNLQDIDGDIPTDVVGDVVDVPLNATLTITVE
jgi:hypothetical protein